MTEQNPELPFVNHAVEEAAIRLIRLLGVEKFLRLPDQIEDVQQDTLYGEVIMRIADGRVDRVRVVKSYE